MTINKAQGQTLKRTDLINNSNPSYITRRQFRVACSRVNNLYIYALNKKKQTI